MRSIPLSTNRVVGLARIHRSRASRHTNLTNISWFPRRSIAYKFAFRLPFVLEVLEVALRPLLFRGLFSIEVLALTSLLSGVLLHGVCIMLRIPLLIGDCRVLVDDELRHCRNRPLI